VNLHGIVSGVIGAVNPAIMASVQVSTGHTTAASGKQTPTFGPPVSVPAQVQPLTYKDIQQVEGLNLNGTRRAIYLNGAVNGLVRVSNKGGDLITIASGPNAGTWLVALVLEAWPDWTKCAVTLQNGS
jgi:hypothetical protein